MPKKLAALLSLLIILNPLYVNAQEIKYVYISIVEQNNQVIYFKDTNLEKGFREKLNKPNGTITDKDALDIEELTLNNKNITSLEGIQKLTNLKRLNLMFNNITDVNPLSV